ncbi:hypothetical protein, partial [Mycolicibacterium austroafricanum]|uniref:hypothetical protein n=1 Tax=Mycolicibacterium austroafricanum TaxID=39687 RepID=UPI00197C2754
MATISENVVIAVNNVEPHAVTRSNTVATAEQIAAARKKPGGVGPPGTIRYPATAPKATAAMPIDGVADCSNPRRPAITAETAAAMATIAA